MSMDARLDVGVLEMVSELDDREMDEDLSLGECRMSNCGECA